MADENKPIIIVNKKVSGGDGHHGGAWKVAYADFATAMMAFFLLLWLLNATSEQQRKGLADYFDPTLPISPVSAGGAGVLGGEDLFFPPPDSGSAPVGLQNRTQAIKPGRDLGDKKASPDNPETDAPADQSPRGSLETGETPRPMGEDDTDESAAGIEAAERALEAELEALASSVADGHLRVRIEPDGLVIELSDLADEPLFAAGSARATPLLDELLEVVVSVISDTLNAVSIIGHTDATPFAPGAQYTNWELSTDRANAARRIMLTHGLPEARLSRVIGAGATLPVGIDPSAPENRRIAIKLLSAARR